MNTDWHDLIQRHLAGLTTDDEAQRLAAALRSDDAVADLYVRHIALDVALEARAASAEGTRELLTAPAKTREFGWPAWRPGLAAAAGVVFGLFTASMVFAYIAPALKRPLTLLDTSFEKVAPPAPNGVPVQAGEWSGDYAEIVGAQQGVTPHSGAKMWRFLRADNALPTDARASYVGEAIHVIDLQPLRNAGVKPGSQLEIGAWFAQGQGAPESRHNWLVKAAAFEGSIQDAPALWTKWDRSSASLAQREVPAVPTTRWQWVSATMVLPANADFLVFECAVVQRKPLLAEGVAEFAAQFVDDVRVRLFPPAQDTPAAE